MSPLPFPNNVLAALASWRARRRAPVRLSRPICPGAGPCPFQRPRAFYDRSTGRLECDLCPGETVPPCLGCDR